MSFILLALKLYDCMSGQQSLLACSSLKHYKRNERWLLIASWFVSTDMRDQTCVSSCVTVQNRKTSSRKNVNQIQRLEKCTRIYSKNIMQNRTQTTRRPQLHTRSHNDTRTHPHTKTHTHVDLHSHTYMYDRHTWFYTAVGRKSALTSDVSVMHTVGPNS